MDGWGASSANNSPILDTVEANLEACVGEFGSHTIKVVDPDGDMITVDITESHVPQDANVQVSPESPLLLASEATATVEVTSDLAGYVTLEYTATDELGLVGTTGYTVNFEFHDCP